MPTAHSRNLRNGRPWGFWLLCAAALLAMVAIVPVDREWSAWLHAEGPQAFARWMKRSLFQGKGFGGGDPVTLFQIAACFAYLLSWNPRSRLAALRPHLGLVVVMSLVVDTALVHTVKLVVGRARPGLVAAGQAFYSPWYAWGALPPGSGASAGSFPSGHTATAAVPLLFAYLLAGDRAASFARRAWGWAVGALALTYALAMAASRCITFDHWPSDGLGMIAATWLALHAIYFWGLRLPTQAAHARQRLPAHLPLFWELRLAFWASLGLVGLTAIGTGVRLLYLPEPARPALWIAAGVALAALSAYAGARLWRDGIQRIGPS